MDKKSASRMLYEVQQLYQDAHAHLITKRLPKIVENVAFYRGLQNNIRTNADLPEGEQALVSNVVRKIVTAAVADTFRGIPDPQFASAKSDQKSRARARMTQRLCRSAVRTGIINQDEIHRTISWAKQTGAAWLKVLWNPDAGRLISDAEGAPTGFEPEAVDGEGSDPQGLDLFVDNGFGNVVPRAVAEGEVEVEFCPTTDVMPDPSARSMRELRYVIHRKIRPVAELEDRFPLDFFGEPSKGRWEVGQKTLTQSGYRGMLNVADDPMWSSPEASRLHDLGNVLAEVTEFWERPSKRFPQGRLCIFSNQMILYLGPNIYRPARFPFVLLQGDNLVSLSIYADGLMADLKQLQKNINLSETKLYEHLDLISNFHIITPYGSGITRNTWGNRSGQVIEYNRGMKPEPWVPPALPGDQFAYTDKQIERAMMLSGYNRMQSGDVPSNISGRTTSFIDELSQRAREPEMIGFRDFFLQVYQQYIYLVKQFYNEGRTLRMVGENASYEAVIFAEEDFDLDAEVVADVYSDQPTSRAARVSEVMDFKQQGLFESSPDAERARRMLGDEYAYKMSYDPFEEHRDKAKRENLEVLQMKAAPIPVATYDVHKVHLEEHDKFRVTLEYEQLPDWQREKMEIHCALHEELARRQGLAAIEDQAGLSEQLAAMPSQQAPAGPTVPGLPNGAPTGAPAAAQTDAPPAPPPSLAEFQNMTDSERRSADQQ